MKRQITTILSLLLGAALMLSLAACEAEPTPTPPPTLDPYAGMVNVPNGVGGSMWVPLHEEVPASTLDGLMFYQDGSFISYAGNLPAALRGIDVSEHQGQIDWQKVAGDGVEFAMIRAGYRGYTEGQLFEDSFFRANIEGALAAGLRVGVYFFSQAISAEEAQEEADFLLELLKGYEITMPVVFDWENIGTDEARTDGLDSGTLTDCCLAFAERVEQAGYEPAVYFYRQLGYYTYDLPRLKELCFWVGAPGETPDFYYAHEIWQYSYTGQVSGIEGDVDLNLYFDYDALPGALPTE